MTSIFYVDIVSYAYNSKIYCFIVTLHCNNPACNLPITYAYMYFNVYYIN